MRRTNFQARRLKEKIVKLKLETPWKTTREIGIELGVDHTWVLKVLKEAGVPTARTSRPKIKREKPRRFIHCRYCNNRLYTHAWAKKFCNSQCYDLFFFYFILCHFCQSIFKIRKSILTRRVRLGSNHIFCNRACYVGAKRAGMVKQRDPKKRLQSVKTLI